MMKKILFVCHGNICRSPMAEFLLKKLVRDYGFKSRYEIASTATSTEEIGNDIYSPAKRCLRSHCVPFSKRQARQITKNSNYRIKVRLLMSLAGQNRGVADPWYTGDFERTYKDIKKALEHLVIEIERTRDSC